MERKRKTAVEPSRISSRLKAIREEKGMSKPLAVIEERRRKRKPKSARYTKLPKIAGEKGTERKPRKMTKKKAITDNEVNGVEISLLTGDSNEALREQNFKLALDLSYLRGKVDSVSESSYLRGKLDAYECMMGNVKRHAVTTFNLSDQAAPEAPASAPPAPALVADPAAEPFIVNRKKHVRRMKAVTAFNFSDQAAPEAPAPAPAPASDPEAEPSIGNRKKRVRRMKKNS
ncbi:uncharacterized protein LOC107786944 [Nicotiana tabacum]|uniref:Uncharacterized protein LOC107786944 n=1 Tax=Nicotiana tabacum TaxID=4097 RepID=A0AC58USU3_TOBAC